MKMNTFMAVAFLAAICLVGSITAGDKASFKFDPYGFVKLDGIYDQNETNGHMAFFVLQQEGDKNDEQFNVTHKFTRFGVNISGQDYQDISVGAQFEVDFYGDTGPENEALLRLRHAYFTVQSSGFEFLAGQTWDLISPLEPAMLNSSPLWGAGNIGFRRPQVRLSYYTEPNDDTKLTMAAGFFRNIGNDNTPTLTLALADGESATDGSDDGTDAGIPSAQGMLDLQYQLQPGTMLQVGVSGLWGQMKAESEQLTNTEKYESWGVSGHLCLSLASGFGISGEAFSGQNLGVYNGAVFAPSTIEGVDCFGGWGSVWVEPNEKFAIYAGAGMDDPKDEDLGNGDRSKNTCIFGNIQYHIVPQVTLGLEISHWQTEYLGDDDTSDNLRAQSVFMLNF
jgi:hypothetical protein